MVAYLFGMATEYVTPGQHHIECLLLPNVQVVDLHQQFFRLFIIARRRFRLCIIIVERIAVDKETPYRIQIDKNFFELTVEEKCRCHTLSSGYGVTFGCTAANQMEILLSIFQVFSLCVHGNE